MTSKRIRNGVVLVGLLWDTGWKIAAIRKAVQLRQIGWIAPLLGVNSLGVLPLIYLWRRRHKAGRASSTSPGR